MPVYPDLHIVNNVFAEIAARYLGQHSPACKGKAGCDIAGKRRPGDGRLWRVDSYGFTFGSFDLGNFTARHDAAKWEVDRQIRWADRTVITEVYGLLAADIHQLPQPRRNERRMGHGVVPDMFVRGRGLAEVKTVGRVPSRYPGGLGAARPVEKRASEVQVDIEKAVKAIDTPDGRLLRKLRDHGPVAPLVFGAYGEWSNGMKQLAHWLAEAKTGTTRKQCPQAYAVVKKHLQRYISRAYLIAIAEEIVVGLFYSGPGGKARWESRHKGREANDAAVREAHADANQQLGRTHGDAVREHHAARRER